MRLSEPVRQRLAREYKVAADQMREATDLPTKLYFFSVFFGEANRALNVAWDANVALLHMVLQSTHTSVNGRLEAPLKGAGLSIGLPKGLGEALTESSIELAELFQHQEINEEKLHRLLARLAELAYVVTGNGYYLYLRGAIKV